MSDNRKTVTVSGFGCLVILATISAVIGACLGIIIAVVKWIGG